MNEPSSATEGGRPTGGARGVGLQMREPPNTRRTAAHVVVMRRSEEENDGDDTTDVCSADRFSFCRYLPSFS